MNRYAIYSDTNGRIVMDFQGPEDQAAVQCDEGQSYVAVAIRATDSTHYINPETGKPNKRQPSPCTPSRTEVPADGTTHVTLSQMREGTQVRIRGPVNDDFTASGSEQITFAVPGTYTITATASFPALSKTVTIHAS